VKLKGLRSDPEFQPVLFICSIVSNSPKCGRPAPTRVLIYCSDYRCSHSVVMAGSDGRTTWGHLRAVEDVAEVEEPCQRGGAPGARGGVALALPAFRGLQALQLKKRAACRSLFSECAHGSPELRIA
jgi:hypothetical protein